MLCSGHWQYTSNVCALQILKCAHFSPLTWTKELGVKLWLWYFGPNLKFDGQASARRWWLFKSDCQDGGRPTAKFTFHRQPKRSRQCNVNHCLEPPSAAVPSNAFVFAARLHQHDGAMRQGENAFIFCLKIAKRDFQTENKKVNAQGLASHGKGSILGIFTVRTARVFLAVMGSENGWSLGQIPAFLRRRLLRLAFRIPEHQGKWSVLCRCPATHPPDGSPLRRSRHSPRT